MKEWGQKGEEEEGRREEWEGHAGCIVPGGGKERQTWNPGCSHRASLNRLGGQQIPDGPHLGGCGHPVAPQGSEGIVGLARRGWEYGAQDRESFTKPGWVWPSRQPSRVAGEACGWSPSGGEGREGSWGWEVENSEAGVFPRSLSISAVRLEPQSGMCRPALNPTISTYGFGGLYVPP